MTTINELAIKKISNVGLSVVNSGPEKILLIFNLNKDKLSVILVIGKSQINNPLIPQIKTIFNIIGAADAAANLLCEFNIAAKKDAKQINNRNGKVIRVKVIAIPIFSTSPTKPGAIRDTKTGINN